MHFRSHHLSDGYLKQECQMRKTIEERIREAEERLKQLKAKRQQIEARKRAAEAKAKRAADTRKKILVGAAVLAMVQRGDWKEEYLLEIMDYALSRDDDRALFGLGPKGGPGTY
jgi:hypothetical protein